MPSSTLDDLTLDVYDHDTIFDPHALFRRMRAEAPLYHNEEQGFYAVSRYADCEQVLVDHKTFSSRRGVTLELLQGDFEIPAGTVILDDPPVHDVYRGLLSRMFTARRVTVLEPMMRKVCAEQLDPHVGGDGFDVVADLASVLPMKVISGLIGIPDGDQEKIRDHFRNSRTEENTSVLLGDVFGEYVDWRIEHPSDDIMTELLNVEFEDVDGTKRRLTREELLAYISIVTAAGNETTTRLIGWTAKLLGDHPDQRRSLVDDPSFVPNAIEEILRYEPSALQDCRYVAQDVELHGEIVPAGSFMVALIPSANRDEERHEDSDRFDVQRAKGPLLTFGFGAHYCLGQALARMEGRVALQEILARFPDWEVDDDNAQFGYLPDMRGWDSLPITLP